MGSNPIFPTALLLSNYLINIRIGSWYELMGMCVCCRNCILMENCSTVKITDVAKGISLFNSDYSQVKGRHCAPIRWQPWETILLVRKKGAPLF